MSKVNYKAIFYAEQVLALRNSLGIILINYEEFTKDISPEMRADINLYLAHIHKMIHDHFIPKSEEEIGDNISD